MATLKPHKDAPKWEDGDCAERTIDCLRWLRVHGFVTDGEREKIVVRIRKWYNAAAAGKEGR
jgi:hypothetical protein